MDRTPQPQLVRRAAEGGAEPNNLLYVQTMNILKDWEYPYALAVTDFRDAQGIDQMKAFVLKRLGFDKSVFVPLLTLVGYDPIVHSSVAAESVAVSWLVQCVHWADQTLIADLSPFTARLLSCSDVPVPLTEPRSGLRARPSNLPMTQNRKLRSSDDKYIQRIIAIVSSDKGEDLIQHALREFERNGQNLVALTDIDYLIFLIFRIRINYNDDSQRTKVNDQVCRFILLLMDMYTAQLKALADKYSSVSTEHEQHQRMYQTSVDKVNCLKEDIGVLESQIEQQLKSRGDDRERKEQLQHVCELKKAENERLMAEWESLRAQTGAMDAHIMKARDQEEVNMKLQAGVEQQKAEVQELRERNRDLRLILLRKCAAVQRKYDSQEVNKYMQDYDRGAQLERQMQVLDTEQDVSQLLRLAHDAATAINRSTYDSLALIYIDDKAGQDKPGQDKRADRFIKQAVQLYKSIKEKYQSLGQGSRGVGMKPKRRGENSSQLLLEVYNMVEQLIRELRAQSAELTSQERQAMKKLDEEEADHAAEMINVNAVIQELERQRDCVKVELQELTEECRRLKEKQRQDQEALTGAVEALNAMRLDMMRRLDEEEHSMRQMAQECRQQLHEKLQIVQDLLDECHALQDDLRLEVLPQCNRQLDAKADEIIARIRRHQHGVVFRLEQQENIPVRRTSVMQCIEKDEELEGAVTARETLDVAFVPRVADSLTKIFSAFTGRIGKQTDKRVR